MQHDITTLWQSFEGDVNGIKGILVHIDLHLINDFFQQLLVNARKLYARYSLMHAMKNVFEFRWKRVKSK